MNVVAKKVVGKEAGALVGVDSGPAVSVHQDRPAPGVDGIHNIPLSAIDTNPYQPRRDFNPEELASLAQSIATHGVIQPIVVRPAGGRYQIIAGERRFRAVREAGLSAIPAKIVQLDDRQASEIALVENLQRQDLNAMEKALAFQEYITQYASTHEELAQQIGVDRTTVTNFVRLLELPEAVQQAVRVGQISFGHARALLSLNDTVDQVTLCRRITAESLSVRQVEAIVREEKAAKPVGYRTEAKPTVSAKPTDAKSNQVAALENTLRQALGVKVEIKTKDNKTGAVILHFGSHDDFERIVRAVTGR